jgi:hypothetical protein
MTSGADRLMEGPRSLGVRMWSFNIATWEMKPNELDVLSSLFFYLGKLTNLFLGGLFSGRL